MINFVRNLFGKDYAHDPREERATYNKLHRLGDVTNEIVMQRKSIEREGDKVLEVIINEKDAIIVYRRSYEDEAAEDSAVFLRLRVIEPKGVRQPEPRLNAVYYKDKALIDIGDISIFGQNINRGYGSILMKQLIDVAHTQSVKNITGMIADTDWDHVDRLKHFYEKHGFSVILDSKNKCGNIALTIAE